MKHPRRLKAVEQAHLRSISRFCRDLNPVTQTLSPHEVEVRVGYIAINLLNCWSNFVRTYFISCASGAVSPSGGVITSSLSTGAAKFNHLLGSAVRHFRPGATPRADGTWDSRDEPTWHDSATIIALANAYNFSNKADISAAFTFGYTAHRNLVVFRNYYGHKNQSTLRKAQNLAPTYSIPSNMKPTDILLSSPSLTSGSLLEVWTTELSDTIEYLCS